MAVMAVMIHTVNSRSQVDQLSYRLGAPLCSTIFGFSNLSPLGPGSGLVRVMAFAKRSARVELPRMAGESPALGALGRSGSMASMPGTSSRKRLPSSVPKVFVITGNPESANLDVVREELVNRGFTEGEGEEFLLKWGPRSKVDWRTLAPPQLVNHYEHDFALTTKSGLAEALQASSSPVDSRDFYPTSFHLDRASAIFEFAQEFKFSKAWCLLKEWLAHQEGGIVPETFSDAVIRTALQVVKRRMEDIDSQLMADTNEAKQVDFAVKRREWDVLSAADFDHPGVNVPCEDWLHESFRRQQAKQDKKHLLEKYDRKLQQIAEHSKAKGRRKKGSLANLNPKTKAKEDLPIEKPPELTGLALHDAVVEAMECLKEHPQFNLNRRNIWILKPSNSLRGHGIMVRSFKDTWGFLRSDSVPGDVFVGLREMLGNPHLTTLAEGNTVLFDVRKVGGDWRQPLIQVSEPSAVPSQRHSGWVSAWLWMCAVWGFGEPSANLENMAGIFFTHRGSFTGSWGFINSPSFSGDLFVGLRNNPQLSAALAAGDQVEFSIRQMDNKTEAIDVHVLGHGPGTGPAHRNDGANATEKGAQVRHLVGQRLEGSVRSFRDAWGFVVSEAFQGDLYLHRRNNSELGPVQAGDPVTFQVSEEAPGHFHAVDCRVLPVPLAQLMGQRLCLGRFVG
eukprot:s78_g9.t1